MNRNDSQAAVDHFAENEQVTPASSPPAGPCPFSEAPLGCQKWSSSAVAVRRHLADWLDRTPASIPLVWSLLGLLLLTQSGCILVAVGVGAGLTIDNQRDAKRLGAKVDTQTWLTAQLNSKDPDVRHQAVIELRRLSVDPTSQSRYVPLIVQRLQDENGVVRREAAFALGAVGAPAVDYILASMTNSSDPVLLSYGAVALGTIGAPAREAVPFLVDRFPRVRESVRYFRSQAFEVGDMKEVQMPRASIVCLKTNDLAAKGSFEFGTYETVLRQAIQKRFLDQNWRADHPISPSQDFLRTSPALFRDESWIVENAVGAVETEVLAEYLVAVGRRRERVGELTVRKIPRTTDSKVFSDLLDECVRPYDQSLTEQSIDGRAYGWRLRRNPLLGLEPAYQSEVIVFSYTLDAGAYALRAITGQNLGVQKSVWVEWLRQR